jgi:hypothetical protein
LSAPSRPGSPVVAAVGAGIPEGPLAHGRGSTRENVSWKLLIGAKVNCLLRQESPAMKFFVNYFHYLLNILIIFNPIEELFYRFGIASHFDKP